MASVRHREALGDPGHGRVMADHRLKRPAQAPAGQLRPRLGGPGGVLAPHVPAVDAPVPANRDQQRRGPPPERRVPEPADHRVARRALAPAPPAPLVGLHDPAGQHRTIGLQALPDDFKAELVQAGEGGQVRTGEGSDRNVEVFRLGSVRTPIIGRPRPLTATGPGHPAISGLHPQLRRAP
jgi:hypothetical protein